MAVDDTPGEEHAAFKQWAKSQGVEINGISPARFPGRRLGMKATRRIEENEVMLRVPVSAMLTIDSIPSSFVEQFPAGTSIHCILSAFLAHGDAAWLQKLDPWRKVWPEFCEFEETMPVLWPKHLRQSNAAVQSTPNDDDSSSSSSSSSSTPSSSPVSSLLPPSISGLWNTFKKEPVGVDYETRYQNLLSQQEQRLQSAWTHVRTVYPETDWRTFAYYWCIINSRSFYYVSPGKDEPEDWNDAIAMVPFADYFNHADDDECEVIWTGENYLFKATRQYEQGEEIYMSYGAHSNDFLFVEYGFYLPTNPSDTIYLDDIIFQDLTIDQKKDLAAQDLFGNFDLTLTPPLLPSSSSSSSSTTPTPTPTKLQAAAALKTMNRRDWKLWITGRSQRGFSLQETTKVIRGWIEVYRQECTVMIERIDGMLGKVAISEWERGRYEMLVERWRQVKALCEGGLEAIASASVVDG
ncbi:ribosomal N-lysine methyltransferase [Aspergillus saccharolyticus JOP 1030-1]|uniref:Ribosomal N-lysine methyltransferase n=1 Tax=Aspergillus saccharolyticus JOP 1030-1 TaxID=1450539 RepID=A0A318Z3N6_9EURO|nr:ribosomal N-lysine methyltransferase [Aspergillus saccharolyticus JOP 1030-1]PYH41609.1 ribosomal N-lysine methyltransferase [Aspergillus saccharolyticus JOP 1030-1]